MPSVIRDCNFCKKPYKVWASYVSRGDGMCCSLECRFGYKELKRTKDKFCITCNKKLGWSAKYQPQRNIKYCRKCFSMSKNFKDKVLTTTFKTGLTPWNKGLEGFMAGEKNNMWKGGISKINRPERLNLMGTFKYKDWRIAVFERDNFTCKVCYKKDCYLQADHIKRWSENPDIRFDLDNGQTLCKGCHKIKTILENKTYWRNQYGQNKPSY